MFEVELDIFSGRPNPRWTLDGREEAELIERMSDRTAFVRRWTPTDIWLSRVCPARRPV